MFHVELRHFPHVAREFNLTEAELQARIVLPWVRGGSLQLQDRRWTPDRTRLTIYEGPAIEAADRGMGRGWSRATRGEDVTARMIAAGGRLVPQAKELKQALMAATASIPLSEVVSMAGASGRPSERLAAAEQAVWELLQEGNLALIRAGAGEAVAPADWERVLLAWETWSGSDVSAAPRRASER